MTAWTSDELARIGGSEELQIAPRRRDGSLRRPVPIWVVRAGDDLYVRSWRGAAGSWYRTARATHEARISAGGVDKDVSLAEVGNRGRRRDRRRLPRQVRPVLRRCRAHDRPAGARDDAQARSERIGK
jgi:hypothetical protein